MRRMAVVLVAGFALAVGAIGCSSGQTHPQHFDAVQTGAGGRAALAAQPSENSERNAVRLGFVAVPEDAIALVGLQDNLYREDLGSQAGLEATRYPTAAAAAQALEDGELDAAYLDPVSAVGVWQATHEQVRVMAGASSTAGQASVLLVVATRFLVEHPLSVQGLLKGQIQAMQLLVADPASGRRLAAAEMTALGMPMDAARFERATASFSFTCDPLQDSVLALAQRAAKSGALRAITSLEAMYDLVPVDELLISAGLRPVSRTAG
jgi:NitT/TauT family transport system substrate-binding protein